MHRLHHRPTTCPYRSRSHNHRDGSATTRRHHVVYGRLPPPHTPTGKHT